MLECWKTRAEWILLPVPRSGCQSKTKAPLRQDALKFEIALAQFAESAVHSTLNLAAHSNFDQTACEGVGPTPTAWNAQQLNPFDLLRHRRVDQKVISDRL